MSEMEATIEELRDIASSINDIANHLTGAHALCEFKLRTALGIEAKDPTEDLSWYNSEMEDVRAAM